MFFWKNINLISLSLLPVSWFFCLLVRLRLFLYKTGFLKTHQGSIPLIIVGNISAGGTGKTPLIIYLLKFLSDKGIRPAIISRGYKGRHPQLIAGNSVLVTDDMNVEQTGDEPWLIYQQTQVPLVIGRNRTQSVKILEKMPVDIILSDDGLQHYAIHHDMEICLIDEEQGNGNGFCLPAGPLRERAARLEKTDFVVYKQTTMYSQQADDKKIKMKLKISSAYSLHEPENQVKLDFFKNKTVHAIAGIGYPERFFIQLKQAGLTIIKHAFADHHHYSEDDINFEDKHPVLMTEKDAVKCHQFKTKSIWVIPIEIDLNMNFLEKFYNKTLDLLSAGAKNG